MPSIVDDDKSMEAVALAGYGFLVLSPSAGAEVDDEKYERIVIKLAEAMRQIGEVEDANFAEMACSILEFAARYMSAPFSLKAAPCSEQRRVADEMSKNLRKRIMGCCRNEGPAQETLDN